MTLIGFVSAKGSPGVTTTTMGLAALWDAATVVDLDPVGGDVAYRHLDAAGVALAEQPGLVSLGAAVRSGETARLAEHVQETLVGPHVLVGATGPRQAQGLGRAWPHLARALRDHDGDVFVDGGRFALGSPVTSVLEESDAVVFLVRSEIAAVAHLRDRLTTLRESWSGGRAAAIPLGLIVVGNPRDRRSADDIGTLLASAGVSVDVLGVVADDPKGVDRFTRGDHRALSRTVFGRSLVDMLPKLREFSRSRPAEVN